MKVECNQCMSSNECGEFFITRRYFACNPPYLTDEELQVFVTEFKQTIRRLQDEGARNQGDGGFSQRP